jgi:hypothetical protein
VCMRERERKDQPLYCAVSNLFLIIRVVVGHHR